MSGVKLGSLDISAFKLGTLEVSAIYLGLYQVYSSMEKLATPTNLSITDTTLSFDPVENAESYEVFADGVSIGTYSV